MELRHLKYFMRAAELSHFTRAAESLYISQPSLSVHIQQLEEELKTKLFARVGRNVRLTESGQVLFEHVKRAVSEIEAAGQQIDAMTGVLQGTLTIASVSLFGSKYLPNIVDEFSAKYPEVRLKLKAARADDIETEIVAGNVDLGFSLLPVEHTEINTTELMTIHSDLIVGKTHPLAKHKQVEITDFESLIFALPSHKIASSRPIGGYFEAIGVTPKITVEQDEGHALLELVKVGRFATLLPRFIIRDDPDLVFLPLPGPEISIGFGAMWTQLSAAAAAFMQHVENHRRDYP
ncbi:MAG TPA: LysR substrate-binding domain-containing protein [Candidatus Obscuribacterales bacterium]